MEYFLLLLDLHQPSAWVSIDVSGFLGCFLISDFQRLNLKGKIISTDSMIRFVFIASACQKTVGL